MDLEDRDRRLLLLLTLGGLLARVAFLCFEPKTHPIADERTWTNWAILGLVERERLSPLRTRMVFYPPVYAYFIALSYLVFRSLEAVKWIQVLVGSAIVPAIGLVGRKAFGSRAGLMAAGIAAFYPELIWFSVHFWSETVFAVLLWWGFERLFVADTKGRLTLAAAAGVLLGLATLTRETPLYFLPVAALWLGVRRIGGVARASVFLLVALLTIAPWTVRNWLVFRAFVPVGTAGGLNLYQGNAPLDRQSVYDRFHAVRGRIAQYRWARQQGIQAILDRQPWWIFEKLRDEMPNYWEADSQAVIHIKRGAYGPVAPGITVAATMVVLLPYLLVLALFVLGLAGCPVERFRVLLLLFLLYYVAIHIATHGYARYRLPSMPVVFMIAAWAANAFRARQYPRLSLRGLMMMAAVAVALGLSLAPSIRRNLNHAAFDLTERSRAPAMTHPVAKEQLEESWSR